MTWFKVDDGFHSHPKTLATPAAAIGLWTVAGSWSSHHLTEGFIPADVLPRLLPDAEELATQLVTSGLWKKRRRGFQFHDWTDRNPSREDVLESRAKRAEAGRKGGLASGKVRSKREANASPTVEPPTRPDPTRPTDTENATRSQRTRGSRLPADFDVTDEMLAWAHDRLPGFNVVAETDNFRDYWNAKTGAGATKLDWVATWRNWMRTAAARQTRGRHSKQQETDEMFGRAMMRAQARENNHDTNGSDPAHQVHPRALPAASNG